MLPVLGYSERERGFIMGWTCARREKGVTDAEWFKSEFLPYELVDIGRQGMTAYAALRGPDGGVHARVILLRYQRNDPRFNFCYKDMSEDIGPFECDCPQRILDLLTPTVWPRAVEWRKRCRERLALKPPRLRKGLVIRTVEPITFRGGLTEQTFVVVNPRRKVVRDWPNQYHFYKLNRRVLMGAVVVG